MTRRNRSVPRGMNDQRDRGTRKKDHRAGQKNRDFHTGEQDNFSIFEAWLTDEFVDDSGANVAPSQSFKLKAFLQSTASFDLAPDERLRILAIHWELDCESMDQPKGWNILKRVYQEALKFDSSWGTLFHSMSLSARTCAYWLDDSNPQRANILGEARSICREGIAVDPQNATLHHSIGRCEYDLRNSQQALIHFEGAIEADSKWMWPVLYRAHCLHDLERWAEAASAYEAVDLSFFDGNQQWRGDLMRDQLAECHLRSGQRKKALSEFESVLNRYESNEGSLNNAGYLVRAAKGELRDAIAERTIALLKKEQFFNEAESVANAPSNS